MRQLGWQKYMQSVLGFKPSIIDSTLRDGSHSLRHSLTVEQVTEYCSKVDKIGFDLIMVGHGNGLGASSLLIGESSTSDKELLIAARKSLVQTKLGAFVIPGLATIKIDIDMAIEVGVDVFMVATHCTEASVAKQYINYIRQANKPVIGVLMMYHMTSKERLLEEIKKMITYGVESVILMDSAGRSTPSMVIEVFSYLTNKIDIDLGFHAHNNLGLAVSNTLLALENGAKIVDATIRGLGAGAGNCQLEQLISVLALEGNTNSYKLDSLYELSDEVVFKLNPLHSGVDGISISSGTSGVFSGFKPFVINASIKYNISPYSLFDELGKAKVVAGQEDIIDDYAKLIKRKL